MILTPIDIFKFNFCPYLYRNKTLPEKIESPFTIFEETVANSIIAAEESSILKNSDLNTRKILRKWDYLWYPLATKNNISIKEADKFSIKAASIFTDYCKYDISDIFYPTIATNVKLEKELNRNSFLKSKLKIIKTNLKSKKKSLVLLNFGNKRQTTRELALDLRVQSSVYLLSDNKEDEITYIYIYIDSLNDKTDITSLVFRSKDMENIKININYIEAGIQNKIIFMNKWNCEVCRKCNLFKL